MCVGDLSEEWANGGTWETATAAAKPAAQPSPESEVRMARLVRTIEGEIVPRLVLSRRSHRAAPEPPATDPRAPDIVDVAELVRLLLAHDVGVSSAYVETVRQRGASLEAICLGLLAPAARKLGEMWEEDECNFMQVTVGLCRLHQLLRELSPEFHTDLDDGKASRRILLAPCPGEQHTFGVSVVAQFLRRAGWDVWHEFPATHEEMLRVFCQHRFAVVGLSIASEGRVDALKTTIRAIRQASRNRAVGILVGGPILVIKPELAEALGADAMALDGPQAVVKAEQISSALAAMN